MKCKRSDTYFLKRDSRGAEVMSGYTGNESTSIKVIEKAKIILVFSLFNPTFSILFSLFHKDI